MVSYLTEELVRQGHEVTLFASGDSMTGARLVHPCRQSLRLQKECLDQICHHILMLEQVFHQAGQFDVIHFHIDYLHFPLSRRHKVPHVTTLHGRLDTPEVIDIYSEFNDMPVVSISHAQRLPLPSVNWQGTVYHGLPENLYTLKEDPGEYLAFLGRVSPEKGLDRAVEIAKRAGMKIKVAAKIDNKDLDFFKNTIEPLFRHPLVEYVGEIGEREKNDFLGNAFAVLFPIDWPEPFGLVMIEAMACGTPVIAYRRGSVPEIMENGVTGFIAEDLEDAVKAIERVSTLSRKHCREVFEERFSATRMARDYLKIFTKTAKVREGSFRDPGARRRRYYPAEAGVQRGIVPRP